MGVGYRKLTNTRVMCIEIIMSDTFICKQVFFYLQNKSSLENLLLVDIVIYLIGKAAEVQRCTCMCSCF